MDSCITVEFTKDMAMVKDFATRPEIWENLAEDDARPEDFNPIYNGVTCWLAVYEIENENKNLIGIILAHQDSSTILKFHPYLLKEKQYLGRKMMQEFYKWFLTLPTRLNKLTACIPDSNKKLRNFSNNVGMKLEGYSPESYLKGNQLHGLYYLGMTRKQIEDQVNGRSS